MNLQALRKQAKEDIVSSFHLSEVIKIENLTDKYIDKSAELTREECDEGLTASYLKGVADGKVDARKKLIKEIEEKIPEQSLDDKYTKEEKALMIKMFGNAKTPEYIRERRYGYNQARKELLNLLKKPLIK